MNATFIAAKISRKTAPKPWPYGVDLPPDLASTQTLGPAPFLSDSTVIPTRETGANAQDGWRKRGQPETGFLQVRPIHAALTRADRLRFGPVQLQHFCSRAVPAAPRMCCSSVVMGARCIPVAEKQKHIQGVFRACRKTPPSHVRGPQCAANTQLNRLNTGRACSPRWRKESGRSGGLPLRQSWRSCRR